MCTILCIASTASSEAMCLRTSISMVPLPGVITSAFSLFLFHFTLTLPAFHVCVSLRTSGVAGVIKEVEMDIKRLAKRNFGRDDRSAKDIFPL